MQAGEDMFIARNATDPRRDRGPHPDPFPRRQGKGAGAMREPLRTDTNMFIAPASAESV
jgi:hypothetical protein